MRFHEPLNDVLGNRTQVKVLRLLTRTRSAHTGRELARLIGQSHNSTRFALEELERNGLIVKLQAGRSNLYSLDEDNILIREILLPAFKLEERLLDEVAMILSREIGNELLDIILFGSIAKAEESSHSDMDLVLVFKDGVNPKDVEDTVAEASLLIAKMFGNQVSPVLITKAEFERKKKARQGLWKEISKTGISLINNRSAV
jgi:DNA-binding transcriptional ArsR family regulator